MGSSCSGTREEKPAVPAAPPMTDNYSPDATQVREEAPPEGAGAPTTQQPPPEEYIANEEPEPEFVPREPRQRDPKHIFTVKFKKRPLGVILTSAPDGTCAYVTKTYPKKNKAVKPKKLPIGSKLLSVNGDACEEDKIDDITDRIMPLDPPIELTFCHPDGLEKDEYPDPEPKDAVTPHD